jgi:hypothetical protein
VVVEFVVVKLGKFRDGNDKGGKVGTEIGGRPSKDFSSSTKINYKPALEEARGNPVESCGTAAEVVGSPPSVGRAPKVGRVVFVRVGIAGRPAADTDGNPVVGTAP